MLEVLRRTNTNTKNQEARRSLPGFPGTQLEWSIWNFTWFQVMQKLKDPNIIQFDQTGGLEV